MNESDILILKGDEIISLLAERELEVVEVVRRAYEAHTEGNSSLPHSMFLRFPNDDKNRIIALPAFLGNGFSVAGIKWVSSFTDNLKRGLDRASAVMILNSTTTGRPEAILEGSIISAKRTAASAALAAHTLLDGREITSVGMIGGGLINFETARFLLALCPQIKTLRVYDLDAQRAAQFGDKCAGMFERVEVTADLKTICRESPVIALATTAAQPHINDLSVCQPGAIILHTSLRDLAPELILAGDNVVDDLDHVCRAQTSIHLAEQLVGHRDFVRCSLGEILLGRVPVRTDSDRITIFSPFGLGILDIALGKYTCELGEQAGTGTVLGSFLPSSWAARAKEMETGEMADTKFAETSLKKFGAMERKAIGISQASLIKTERLSEGGLLPLIVRPAVRGVNLFEWATNNRDFIRKNLFESGGILFRNFNIKAVAEFEDFAAAASGCELLEYKERSSPRSQVSGKVYTSTDYPADQSIFVHNENSYQQVWPLNIFFYCAQAAPQGGETPIADTRRIRARIPLEIQHRFSEKKWMYVRNFSERFGLPWQTVFQTTEKGVVETYCRRNNIEVEWRDDGQLTTRAVRPAMTRHPHTGEDIWFNHATFFHVTTLDPTVRDVFLTAFKQEDLPTNTYYGDGSPIEPDVLDELRSIYRAETIAFPWQDGDILMLDNMLAAHGRAPYSGPRKILVAMTEPVSREEI